MMLAMDPGTMALALLGVLMAVVVGAVLFVMLLIPLFKALGWLISRVYRFIAGEIGDIFRTIGAVLLAFFYIVAIVANIVITRWSAAMHYGRAFQSELRTAGACLYRIALGHPLRLLGLSGMTEGFERRLPEVVRAAPGADTPGPRTGQFEGYQIVGSLAGGGSGAKLYIATPDTVKSAAFSRAGLRDVGQVVVKSFSLAEGSSLPQIVRESRSLDAAKRMGLILDHELTQHRFHYVMRYVPGDSLSVVTRRLHAASPADGLNEPQLRLAVGYACDLVRTLSQYHRGGLWHKDVKPDNIIVDGGANPTAHLVDFGLVSSLRSAMTLTTHGTEYFRDPELVRQALKGVKVHEVDGARFDIYAAGAVLFSMLEDSFPAHGVLSHVNKRCPDAVRWIIRRAMTDYDKRYPTADVMLADLRAVARAADPYAVKPVELPSMAEHDEADESQVSVAAHSPIPPLAAAAAIGVAAAGVQAAAHAGAAGIGAAANAAAAPINNGPRHAPRLRMVNWWSGRAQVDPSAPPGSPQDFAAQAGQFAEESVRDARKLAHEVWSGVRAGLGHNAPSPASPATPWSPPMGPRRPAHAQLESARARMAAARERAQKRMSSHGRRPASPIAGMGGVVAAVAVFFAVLAIIVGFSLKSSPAPIAPLPTNVWVNGEEVNADTLMTTALPRTIPSNLRVLVINDIRLPWSDTTTQRLSELMASFAHADITPLGEVPSGSTDKAQVDTAAEVRFVLDADQVPVDSIAAHARIEAWFASHPNDADAIVWIVPPAVPGAQPRLRTFVPHEAQASPRTAIITHALVPTY